MRVLLDESLPVRFGREIVGHDVTTVRGQGWQGLKNGELLQRAQDAGFDVFITADQNIQYQQNLQRSRLGILIIVAKTNSIEDLIPLVPTILQAIAQIQPGRIMRVSL